MEYRYGLLCGGALSLWVLAEFALGFHTTALEIGQYSGYFAFSIPLILIFTALREQQRQSAGILTLKSGISVGFTIAFVSSILFTIFLAVYHHYINPEWIETMVEWQRRKLILGGATDDQIEAFMDRNRQMNNAFAQGIMTLISNVGVGVTVTLLEIPLIKYLFTKRR